ncbi:MAG: type II secretion system protein GspE, partial [Calditrichaeota bacterium]
GQKKLYKGRGCRECKRTGYMGRTGIHELLVIDDTIRSMILRKASTETIRNHAIDKGMLLLRDDGLYKAFAGITSLEEVMRVTTDYSKGA